MLHNCVNLFFTFLSHSFVVDCHTMKNSSGRNDSLKEHIKFLESLGIAGISNHSLLFSKTAPVQAPQEGDDLER